MGKQPQSALSRHTYGSESADLTVLYSSASDAQKDALIEALRCAHLAGQAEAEQRTGRIIAQVLAPLLGVRQPDTARGERSRLRSVLSAVRNLAG